ncbi:MAG TPA: inorganic phosphate transporter [Paracoccus sp. (in: a-proteobacteria)]|nr:inorganic phosphate transporter [Paracoccus sp. (in: a-proteobacteria)]
MRELRQLDKDLDRLSNAESAGLHAARRILRPGALLILCTLAAVALTQVLGIGAAPGLVAAGVVTAGVLALSIGANDMANSLAPAVGAGALPMGAGLAAAALMEIGGVLLASGRVSDRLALGILAPGEMLAGTGAAPLVMLAAMLAATVWIMLATWAGAPVSTTHAIVGGIAGAGLAVFGPAAVNWPGVATIALGWVGTPVAAGLLAASVLALIRARVHRAPDRIAAALRWLPRMLATMAVLMVLYAAALLPHPPGPVPLSLAAGAAGASSLWGARRWALRRIAAGGAEKEILVRVFGLPLAASALLMAFGHGANDAGNVVAPLAVIVQSGAEWGPELTLAPGFLLTVGGGIALGAVLFGRGLVHMVGSRITRLSPVRALCVSLATAFTVLVASRLGLPVSTTHIAVGGVFGVGFYREWEEHRFRLRRDRAPLPIEERRRRMLVRRGHVWRTLAAWTLTVPLVAMLAGGLALLIS